MVLHFGSFGIFLAMMSDVDARESALLVKNYPFFQCSDFKRSNAFCIKRLTG